MASTAVSKSSQGESVSHFTGVRMRVTGVGNLNMIFSSFDNVNQQQLVPFVMNPITNREPFRLANFMEQRASIQIITFEINERFKINRIILFSKPVWTSYPGTE